jgi:hypothetical protein
MNDNTQRIDNALRMLADVTQELHSLRTLMAQPEPSEEHGKWVNTTNLTPQEARVLDALTCCDMAYSNMGEAVEVIKELFPEPLGGTRDQRKIKAMRAVKALITKGYLYEHDDGSLDFGMT